MISEDDGFFSTVQVDELRGMDGVAFIVPFMVSRYLQAFPIFIASFVLSGSFSLPGEQGARLFEA